MNNETPAICPDAPSFIHSYIFYIYLPGERTLITVKYLLDLQVISLEGWTDIMYYVQDAHSFWDWIYFVLLIVVSDRGSVG